MNELEHLLTLPRNLWLIAAVVFLLVEALGAPGVGLLFAGIGALVTGAALYVELIGPEATIVQFTVFFVASAISAMALWKPLRRFHEKQAQPSYDNMVGQIAIATAEGIDHEGGGALWSGTRMRAMLVPTSAAERLIEGEKAVIVEVRGNCLMVMPKSEYKHETPENP